MDKCFCGVFIYLINTWRSFCVALRNFKVLHSITFYKKFASLCFQTRISFDRIRICLTCVFDSFLKLFLFQQINKLYQTMHQDRLDQRSAAKGHSMHSTSRGCSRLSFNPLSPNVQRHVLLRLGGLIVYCWHCIKTAYVDFGRY